MYCFAMRRMWLRKRKSSFWFQLPNNLSVSEKESMLTLRFLSHNVRSDQNFESLGQEMKGCSKDSSASPHREQTGEVLYQFSWAKYLWLGICLKFCIETLVFLCQVLPGKVIYIFLSDQSWHHCTERCILTEPLVKLWSYLVTLCKRC